MRPSCGVFSQLSYRDGIVTYEIVKTHGLGPLCVLKTRRPPPCLLINWPVSYVIRLDSNKLLGSIPRNTDALIDREKWKVATIIARLSVRNQVSNTPPPTVLYAPWLHAPKGDDAPSNRRGGLP